MSKIFISYRRSDSADVAGRIFDHLHQNFRKEHLFKDVDSIPLGADFRTAITDTVQSCDVAVVIIGRGWLTATNSKGARRLDDPDDFVRIEIEGALSRKIPVIPVLVGGAEMPSSDGLPPSLQPLVFRNAVSVRADPDFRNDVGRLMRALRGVVKRKGPLNRFRQLSRLQIVMILSLLGALMLVPLLSIYFSGAEVPANQNNIADQSTLDKEDSTGKEATTTLPQLTTPDRIIPYDPGFLGRVRVPLPTITDEISRGDLLNGQVFDYAHYSLVINERRGMPLYTACNIDRSRLRSIRRDRDQWMLDSRVSRDLQKGDDVYVNNDWDRGHIVPRIAMAWGDNDDEAKAAAQAVFFYPNSVPQHSKFNQGIWSKLENYVLRSLEDSSTKLSVFSGPVFRITDFEYRGSRIPQSFWKIVAVSHPSNSNNLFVYAYLMDQYSLTETGSLQTLEEIGSSSSFDPKAHQVSVERIESLVPLQFGVLKRFDTYTKQ